MTLSSLLLWAQWQIYPDVLSYRKRDEQWLVHELKKKGIASEKVFLATINRQNELQFSLKNEKEPQVPPLHH
ncbi:hypothetical protein QN310_26150 [Brevibacillus brevis]|nr:YetF domain-containing protein [Brevibacillus brevis]WJQ80894.1 hypothetical protein QN310_26150 [Brevibacillus brevis]